MAGNALAAPFFIPGTPTVGLTTAIPSPAAAVTIFAAGSIVNCADISNPPTASGQGIGASELLYVDMVTTASATSPTSIPLSPGDRFPIRGPISTPVSVFAVTAGHKFIAVRY
jgi:hypothetical protein